MKLGSSLERHRRRRRDRAPAGLGPGDEGGAPRRGRRFDLRKLLGLLAGLVLAGWLAGYVFATQVVFPAPPAPGDLFEVPDLRGLGFASARERLAGARLDLGAVDSLHHPTATAGVVLGQSPLPGQVAPPGSMIRVTLSQGPQVRAVPDVLRLEQERARVVLETSGFVVQIDSAEAEEPRGRVIGVSPPPDSLVALPASVRVLVSSGPPLVAMPFVLGLEEAEAVAVLDSLGLVVGTVEEVFRFGRDQGIVVEQEPAAETQLRRGSNVRLAVGRRGRDGER